MVSNREVPFICFLLFVMVQGYQLSTISAKIESSHLKNPEEAIEQSYKSFRSTLFFINPQTIIIFLHTYFYRNFLRQMLPTLEEEDVTKQLQKLLLGSKKFKHTKRRFNYCGLGKPSKRLVIHPFTT